MTITTRDNLTLKELMRFFHKFEPLLEQPYIMVSGFNGVIPFLKDFYDLIFSGVKTQDFLYNRNGFSFTIVTDYDSRFGLEFTSSVSDDNFYVTMYFHGSRYMPSYSVRLRCGAGQVPTIIIDNRFSETPEDFREFLDYYDDYTDFTFNSITPYDVTDEFVKILDILQAGVYDDLPFLSTRYYFINDEGVQIDVFKLLLQYIYSEIDFVDYINVFNVLSAQSYQVNHVVELAKYGTFTNTDLNVTKSIYLSTCDLCINEIKTINIPQWCIFFDKSKQVYPTRLPTEMVPCSSLDEQELIKANLIALNECCIEMKDKGNEEMDLTPIVEILTSIDSRLHTVADVEGVETDVNITQALIDNTESLDDIVNRPIVVQSENHNAWSAV